MAKTEVLDQETLHAVLAAQARQRSASELWTTAVGGATNASLLWLQFPSLHWLAAGFAAVAAYGTWGLIDRRISVREFEYAQAPSRVAVLRALRGMTPCYRAGVTCVDYTRANLRRSASSARTDSVTCKHRLIPSSV